MKAYMGGLYSDPDVGNIIVFAKNAKEAKELVLADDVSDYQESYIDVYARRAHEFDGMEDKTEYELMLEKWRQCWWFKQPNLPNPDEATDEDFHNWFKKEFIKEGE